MGIEQLVSRGPYMSTFGRWKEVAETPAQARHVGLFVKMLQAVASARAVFICHGATECMMRVVGHLRRWLRERMGHRSNAQPTYKNASS